MTMQIRLKTGRLCALACAVLAGTDAIADVVVDPAVYEALATGMARVLVELKLPNTFAPEGTLSEERVRAQRAQVAAAQEAVLSRLEGHDARTIRQPATLPFLALEIGRAELALLVAAPEAILHVYAETSAAPQREANRERLDGR